MTCKKSYVVVPGVSRAGGAAGPVEIEPCDLLGVLPPELFDLDPDLRVYITDGIKSVTFNLGVFMSRPYKVRDGVAYFGVVTIRLPEMRIFVGYEIRIVDGTGLENPVVD